MQKSQNARVMSSRHNSKMAEIQEKREKQQQDDLNKFVHQFNQKEKKMQKFSKEIQKKNKERSDKKMMHRSHVSENQKHLRMDMREQHQAIEERH